MEWGREGGTQGVSDLPCRRRSRSGCRGSNARAPCSRGSAGTQPGIYARNGGRWSPKVPDARGLDLGRSVSIIDRAVGFGPDPTASAGANPRELNRSGRVAKSPVGPELDGEVGLCLDLFPVRLVDAPRSLLATLNQAAVSYNFSAGYIGQLEAGKCLTARSHVCGVPGKKRQNRTTSTGSENSPQ